MGPLEALKIALGKEKTSITLYKEFAEQYPVARDTFQFLVGEEEKHKKLIEEKITALTNEKGEV